MHDVFLNIFRKLLRQPINVDNIRIIQLLLNEYVNTKVKG